MRISSLMMTAIALSLAVIPMWQAPAQARDVIISGDWAASCVERRDGGSVNVICERFGGFLNNAFPAGCDGANLFICRGRDLCSVARDVSIIENGNAYALQRGIERCSGPVRQPARR